MIDMFDPASALRPERPKANSPRRHAIEVRAIVRRGPGGGWDRVTGTEQGVCFLMIPLSSSRYRLFRDERPNRSTSDERTSYSLLMQV